MYIYFLSVVEAHDLPQCSGAEAQSATIEPRMHPRRRSSLIFLFAVAEEDMLSEITEMSTRVISLTALRLMIIPLQTKMGKKSRLPLCNRLRPSFLFTALDRRTHNILHA